MRVLKLRARAREVDEAVLKTAQELCAAWWMRWRLPGGTDAPLARLVEMTESDCALNAAHWQGSFHAEVDSRGVGHAICLSKPEQLIESALGRPLVDLDLRLALAERMLFDLVELFALRVRMEPCRSTLQTSEVSGYQWMDRRTSVRQLALELNGMTAVLWRWTAAAVDMLGPDLAITMKPSNSNRALALVGRLETHCQVLLNLEGLKWKDLTDCAPGDVLVGHHGLNTPVSLMVDGRPVALDLLLGDCAGERTVRIAELTE